MHDKERLLAYLRMKASECYIPPKWNTPKELRVLNSCHNWAMEQVIKEIEKSDRPPIETAELFVKQMDDFSCMNRNTSRMFSTAKNSAEWILDILISFEERSK